MLRCPKIQIITLSKRLLQPVEMTKTTKQEIQQAVATMCEGKAPAIYKEDVQFLSWPSKEESFNILARDKWTGYLEHIAGYYQMWLDMIINHFSVQGALLLTTTALITDAVLHSLYERENNEIMKMTTGYSCSGETEESRSQMRQPDEQWSVGRRINNNNVSPVVSHMQTKAHTHTFD